MNVCVNICWNAVCWCACGYVCVRLGLSHVVLCVFVFICVTQTCSECFWHSLFPLCSMRNANGLTAADLAHAQGFQECAQMLANAQNLQQNMAQSLNGAFLNGVTQNGGHAHATIQGRSFLNGVPNRKRSFEGNEANPLKKSRPNGEITQRMFLLLWVTFWEIYKYININACYHCALYGKNLSCRNPQTIYNSVLPKIISNNSGSKFSVLQKHLTDS